MKLIRSWHRIGIKKKKLNMNSIRDKRVFIVDDNTYWREILSQMLQEIGLNHIHTFENGTDCILNLHLNPGIVFLDYQMEGVNGLKVLQEIKAYYPGIGVVFCTGNEDLGVALDAIKLGSQDYLLKENCTKKELLAILKRLVKAESQLVK